MNLSDEKELLSQLRQMDMKEVCGDTQSLSMAEIIKRMSEVKERSLRDLEESKRLKTQRSLGSPSQHRTLSPTSSIRPHTTGNPFSPTSRPSTVGSSPGTPGGSLHRDFSIARFREKTPKWEKCLHPDPAIEKTLYRIPCFDPTGKNFASLGREAPKGVVTWNPPENDRDIPDVNVTSCTHTFQSLVSKHMEKTVDYLDEEYAAMPNRTERERTMKARAGADLFNLQQTRDKIKFSSPTRSRAASPPGPKKGHKAAH